MHACNIKTLNEMKLFLKKFNFVLKMKIVHSAQLLFKNKIDINYHNREREEKVENDLTRS